MRLGRIELEGEAQYALRLDDESWQPVSDPFEAFALGQQPRPIGDRVVGATVLAPTTPSTIVGIAQPSDDIRLGAWLKSPRTVTASGMEVRARRDAGTTVIEGEVAVVIGRETTDLTQENAHEYVLGVTAVNDVSSPDRAAVDVRNFEAKGGIGYTPLGPWIETDIDLDNVDVSVSIDGELRIETGSYELPASIGECLAYVAHWVALGPGDVVMAGAPRTAFPIELGSAGVLVEITVGGVPLVNRFV